MFRGGTSSGGTGSYGRLWYDEMRCTVIHLSQEAHLLFSAESVCGLFALYAHVVVVCHMAYVICRMLCVVSCILYILYLRSVWLQ